MNSISDYLTVTTPLPQYLPYPRFLLDTDLSHTAKLLYTLLLDRATLSQKNNWIDAQGRIYVVYPLSHLSKDLGCSISSITRSFTELENAQLVERIRSGFSKPSRILLKVPYTTQNCAVTVCKNAEHDCAEMSSMIARKCTPNQRKKFNRIDQKIFLKNPLDCQSSATRKWRCLLNNCHRTENNPTPSQCSTPTLDEWSAFATFLADVIEKYASVLEIDNVVSSTNDKNQQDAVDTALAA